MSERNAMAELLARVRAATGPDRELDSDVFAAFGMTINPNPTSFEYGCWPDEKAAGACYYLIDPITSSTDAALALVERVLPGWRLSIGGRDKLWAVMVRREGSPSAAQPFAESGSAPLALPLAILSAALSALIDMEAEHAQ